MLHFFYGAHKTYGQFTFALRLLALAYATMLASTMLERDPARLSGVAQYGGGQQRHHLVNASRQVN